MLVYDNIYTNEMDGARLGGDLVTKKELVMELIQKHNGFITSSEATAAGINNKVLQTNAAVRRNRKSRTWCVYGSK
jgi:hypothetical protein